VGSHFLSMLERAAIGEIGSDAGRAERVIADRRSDAGCRRTPADHEPGGVLIHRAVGERIGFVPGRGAEQPSLAVLGEAGGIDIGTQRLGEGVMARHRMLLAAFFVQQHVQPAPRDRKSSTFIFSAALMRAKE
jgi:hypothetical protein